MSKVWGFDEASFRRVREAARRVLNSPRKGAQRRRQPPIVGGGGGGCQSANAIIHVTIGGSPTGGDFDWPLEVNESEETMTFDWNMTAANVQTELETHTEIGSGDVSVSGGPFPNAVIAIEFTGDLANTPIKLPLADKGGLTGADGVSVLSWFAQLGFE